MNKQISIGSFAVMTILLIQWLSVLIIAWVSPATVGITTATVDFGTVISNYWVALDSIITVPLMYIFGKIE